MTIGLSERSQPAAIDSPNDVPGACDAASVRFARVALDVPLAHLGASLFDYSVAPELAAVVTAGSWVVVPWGRGRRVALVVETAAHSEIDAARVKANPTSLATAIPRLAKNSCPPCWSGSTSMSPTAAAK